MSYSSTKVSQKPFPEEFSAPATNALNSTSQPFNPLNFNNSVEVSSTLRIHSLAPQIPALNQSFGIVPSACLILQQQNEAEEWRTNETAYLAEEILNTTDTSQNLSSPTSYTNTNNPFDSYNDESYSPEQFYPSSNVLAEPAVPPHPPLTNKEFPLYQEEVLQTQTQQLGTSPATWKKNDVIVISDDEKETRDSLIVQESTPKINLPTPKSVYTQYLFDQGMCHFNTGNPPMARYYFEQLRDENDTNFINAQYFIGKCHIEEAKNNLTTQRLNVAMPYLKKVKKTNDYYENAQYYLGYCHFIRKTDAEYRISSSYFKRVSYENPNYERAQYFLGSCCYKLGKPFNAKKYLNRVTQRSSCYPFAQLSLGKCHSRLGEYLMAWQAFKEALEHSVEDSPEYLEAKQLIAELTKK